MLFNYKVGFNTHMRTDQIRPVSCTWVASPVEQGLCDMLYVKASMILCLV